MFYGWHEIQHFQNKMFYAGHIITTLSLDVFVEFSVRLELHLWDNRLNSYDSNSSRSSIMYFLSISKCITLFARHLL